MADCWQSRERELSACDDSALWIESMQMRPVDSHIMSSVQYEVETAGAVFQNTEAATNEDHHDFAEDQLEG